MTVSDSSVTIAVDRLTGFYGPDLHDLCDAAEAAILHIAVRQTFGFTLLALAGGDVDDRGQHRRRPHHTQPGKPQIAAGRLDQSQRPERQGDVVADLALVHGDQFQAGYSHLYEFLPQPFNITPTVTLPVGGYHFQNGRLAFNLGRQRKMSGNATLGHGTFYNGTRTAVSVSQGRFTATNALAIEPTYSFNNVDLDQGAFTTHLIGSRVTYTLTPLMFVSALLQFNSATNSVSTNARMRWEYRPGSELFVVYNEERNTLTRAFPSLSTRAFIVKVNRLLRF